MTALDPGYGETPLDPDEADALTDSVGDRLTAKSVGIDPSSISVELRSSLQTIACRWEHTDDWTARELGIAVHADTVRIHPFVDGNGRSTRLLANLVFVAAQESDESLLIYDWDVEKRPYVDLLRTYDSTRDPAALAAFIPVTLVS